MTALLTELERLVDQMDDFGKDLLLLQARSIAQMRPAVRKSPSLYVVGGSRDARGGGQPDVLHLGQSKPLVVRRQVP